MIEGLQLMEAQETDAELAKPRVFTFWKGRVALYALFKALGVTAGDGILLPGYTCAMVPGAVIFAGAKPIYADIDPDSYNNTIDSFRVAQEAHREIRIKAVVIQHTYGIAANACAIGAWARESGIAVIEDCAHAWGSRFCGADGKWHETGTVGDAAIFSSQWSKPVSTGLGGWLETRNAGLSERIARFREEQCTAPSFREVMFLAAQIGVRRVLSSPRLYWAAAESFRRLSAHGILIGTNDNGEIEGRMPRSYAKRMSAFQELLLQKQLADLSVVEHRRKLKNVYDNALSSNGLPVLRVPEWSDPVLLRYPVRVKNKTAVLEAARRSRIELGDWFNSPLHPREAKAEAFGYRDGSCPEGERAAREVVNLPLTPRTTPEMAGEAVEFLKQVGSV